MQVLQQRTSKTPFSNKRKQKRKHNCTVFSKTVQQFSNQYSTKYNKFRRVKYMPGMYSLPDLPVPGKPYNCSAYTVTVLP